MPIIVSSTNDNKQTACCPGGGSCVSLSVDDETLAKIDDRAEARGVDRGVIVREALSDSLLGGGPSIRSIVD